MLAYSYNLIVRISKLLESNLFRYWFELLHNAIETVLSAFNK